MRRRTLACLAVGLWILAACERPSAQYGPADEATLRAMFDSTPVYFKSANFDKWAAQFDENGFLQPPNASTVTGRANLLAWAHAFPPIDDVTFSNVQVVGEGNMAYGTSDYVLKVKGAPADSGKQLVVFRRPPGGAWTIAAVSFSSDLPAPAPAAGAAQPRR